MDLLFSAALLFGFLAVLLGPLFILLLPDLGKHRALHGMLASLALKGAGKLDDVIDGPLPVPRLTASAGGRDLTVAPDVAQEDHQPGSLLFEVKGPLALPRVEVRPKDEPGRSPRGLAPVPLGDKLMERAYDALSDDAAWWTGAAPRLAPALERLAHLGEKPAFALSVHRERIQVRRFTPPKEDAEMEALLIRVGELVDALLASASGAASADPVCLTCGGALAAAELRCRRCRTPYHRACWSEAGGCTQHPCTATTPVEAE
jgi:hypothetical protein